MASTRARVALAALPMALLALAGCGTGEGTVEGPVTVYVSLPLSGPRADEGNDAADGARLALEQADGRAGDLEVRAEFLDDASPGVAWDPVAVGANARTAAQDSSTAAYIGELDSEPTRASVPITNEAGIVQISPGAGAVDLTRPAEGYPDSPDRFRPSGDATFIRQVVPDDEVARAAVALASEDALSVRIVSDGSLYGDLTAAEMTREAQGIGLDLPAAGKVEAVLYAGGPDGVDAVADAVAKGDAGTVIATDAVGGGARQLPSGSGGAEPVVVAGALAPESIPAPDFGADFRARYNRDPGPYAAFGHEAMSLALSGIEQAGDGEFRAAVRDEILGADRADSVLGPYSIDEEGETSLCTVQRYRLAAGALDAARALCAE